MAQTHVDIKLTVDILHAVHTIMIATLKFKPNNTHERKTPIQIHLH